MAPRPFFGHHWSDHIFSTNLVISSQNQKPPSQHLIQFLQQRVGVSENAISLGIRQADSEQAPLPIVLWSFGLLSLSQYQQVLDWQTNQL